jgi:putative flippase GtrA
MAEILKELYLRVTGGARARRFIVVGLVATTIDFSIFNLLFYQAGLALLVANTLSWTTAFSVSFFLNRNWTFADAKHQGAAHHQLLRYFITAGSALLLASAAIWLAALLVPAWAAKIVAIGVTFCWSFTWSRVWVWPQ